MPTVIKNGTIITATGSYRADIAVDDERIVALGHDLPTTGTTVIDANGKFVLPGGIDAHTHLEWPNSADDFEAGTIAAACGGITTIVDFAVQYPGRGLADTIADWRTKADGNVCIDYALHAVVTSFTDETEQEMAALVEMGVTGFKLWMTSSHSGGLGVDDSIIYNVMQAASRLGALVGIHCENDTLITNLASGFLRAQKTNPAFHRRSRPSLVEAEAIRRVTTFAEATGCRLYIPHMSSAAGRTAVREARRRGVSVVAETCPQFLILTDAVYERPDAARFVLSPPIKSASDQNALWDGLAAGDIVSVGSDHCPYSDEMKARGCSNFTLIPNGVPGTETIIPLLYGQGVVTDRLTMEQMVAVTATNPARLFGLYPRKGRIAVGADADLVVFDPDRPIRLEHTTLHSRIGYSIYEDITVPGYPDLTMSRGRIIARDGQFVGEPGWGRFLRRVLPDPSIWERAGDV